MTGVFYPRFFDDPQRYFERVRAEHQFQALTESVKPSVSYRTGVYLSPVTEQADGLHFHLLRCSTNLSGPTESFRATDHEIVHRLDVEAAKLYPDAAPLNHVLAQIYANTAQAKAKISAHADKTKDMPANGIMAFCTFYDQADPADAALTRLQFRLKESVTATDLEREFTLTLAPGSVYFMPLSTNRLYTHAIRPSVLPPERLPTRLGYVVRCSKTEAVHRDGQTYLKQGSELVPLEPPTDEGRAALRELYAAENRTDAVIDYGDRFRFSMNQGDYLAPTLARD